MHGPALPTVPAAPLRQPRGVHETRARGLSAGALALVPPALPQEAQFRRPSSSPQGASSLCGHRPGARLPASAARPALTFAQADVTVHVATVGQAEARRRLGRLEAAVTEHPAGHV